MTSKDIYRYFGTILIATTVLVTGCGESEICDGCAPESRRITFTSPIIKGITRGAKVPDKEQGGKGIPYDILETFRIFGSKYDVKTTKEDVWKTYEYNMLGEEAIYNPNIKGWDTKELHVWNEGKIYAFRGYSPYNINDNCTAAYYNNDATGLKIGEYVTPAIGSQYDLMYAEAVYNQEGPTPDNSNVSPDDNIYYSGVNLKFVHALSSIHFKVRVSPEYINTFPESDRAIETARFGIKQITISGVYNKADFSENSGIAVNYGTFSYVPPTDKASMWTNYSKVEGNSYDFIVNLIATGIPADDAKNLKDLDSKSHIGFMIPQTLPDDAEVSIVWTYNNGVAIAESEPVEFIIKDYTPNWEIGMRYTYTITLSNDFIEFEPSASGMADPQNSGIDIE